MLHLDLKSLQILLGHSIQVILDSHEKLSMPSVSLFFWVEINASRKEQSALRAMMTFIEVHKLDVEFIKYGVDLLLLALSLLHLLLIY